MTNYERFLAGLIYDPSESSIMDEQNPCLDRIREYNATGPADEEKRQALLKEMLGAAGENCHLEPPFYANWGGKHVFLGDNVYANFSLTCVDDGNIYVGSNVKFGPNVTLATAGHPVSPSLREKQYQYNKDIHIGSNVWIGAGAIVLPGVSIGDDTVIGAGSVVTRDIPAGCVAVGNPCRVLREIGERDETFYFRDEVIDWENLK